MKSLKSTPIAVLGLALALFMGQGFELLGQFGPTQQPPPPQQPVSAPYATPVPVTPAPASQTVGLKPPPPGETIVHEIVRCDHVRASTLIAALASVFPADQLRVIVGPESFSPKLETASLATTNSEIRAMQGTAEPGHLSKELILVGHEKIVAQAAALIRRLDHHRDQVRLQVKITDVSFDGLRQLGVNYDFGKYSVREFSQSPTSAIINSLRFAQFGHVPISIDATLSALEQRNQSKTLAEPSISLLDGERAFILIGDKVLYPKLTGYTQAQTPIFDKEEVRVGIYVQVALQMAGHGDLILSVYPQVSLITGYLNVNGASYPQISTREQQTTVRLRDKETLVIGGLITDDEIRNLRQIPLLGRVPALGSLFRSRTNTKTKKDLVIMITPEIMRDAHLEAPTAALASNTHADEHGGPSGGGSHHTGQRSSMPLPRPVFPEQPPLAPLGLPAVRWPEANPYSKAKAELGWRLFFDRRLSADGTIACASCHHPEDAFTDRRERPFGIHGEPGRRNSMSIVNAAYLNNLLWDGRAEHLEAQMGLAVTNPSEMDMNADRFKALLTTDPSLRALFDKAFPGVKDHSLPQAAQAIATFERLVVSGNSPYDRFVAGDKNALSAVQQRGLAVFTKQCASCHAPPLFTTGGYARLGAGHAGLDDGRAEITSQPGDVGAFRIPSLRDVARTAPYMHDGSIATLRDVVHFYLLAPQSGKSIDSRAASIQFTGTDAEDLVEFLQALNGEGWQRYRSP